MNDKISIVIQKDLIIEEDFRNLSKGDKILLRDKNNHISSIEVKYIDNDVIIGKDHSRATQDVFINIPKQVEYINQGISYCVLLNK